MTAPFFEVESAAFSEPGSHAQNEDRYGIDVARDERRAVFAVADGLGGHEDGDIAASLAIDAALRAFGKRRETNLDVVVREALEAAQRAVLEVREELANDMASTICIVANQDENIAWGHVGDSRIYRMRRGSVERLTRDHSVAEAMDAFSSRPRRWFHPRAARSGTLLSSLGAADPQFVVSGVESLACGDTLVLCTDGVWTSVDDRILASAAHADSLDSWLIRLRALSAPRGRTFGDDRTAVVVRFRGERSRRVPRYSAATPNRL